MHVCPECGKAMATGGGLEIHREMQHAPPPAPAPAPAPEHAVDFTPPAAARAPRRGAANPPSPVLWGYDPTVPLTALLVLAMLIAGIGSAVHRSASPAHQIVASAASGAATPSHGATPTTIASVPHQTPATPAPPSAGSPAAIPPAGSQPQAAAQNSPQDAADCKQLVDSLSNRNSKRNGDIGQLIRADTFPALPLPGFERPTVASLSHFDTAKDMAGGDPSDPDGQAIQQLLIQNGFVGADTIVFTNGDSSYGAGALKFTTAAGARAYNRGSTLLACNEGLIEDAKVMPALAGGMNYVLDDGPPFRATFVAGDTVVRLQICHCVQAPDDQALAGQWAQAVASAVGAG